MAGPWEKYGGVQTKPVNVMLPGQYQGQQLQNTRTAQEIRQAQATASADTRTANAKATSAEIQAKTDVENFNAAHPKESPSTRGLYGDDYLKTLSPQDANFIKAISDYRLAIPERYISNYTQGKGVGDPFWKTKIDQLLQYNPSFDMQGYKQKLAARISAATGKLGTSNNALDTAIGHAGLLMQQANGPAGHGGLGVVSYGANALENFLNKGDPALVNYNDTAQKLASEEVMAYRNGQGAEADVNRFISSLDPNLPLEAKQKVIRNTMDLFASKIAANLNQYDWGTQGGKPPLSVLNPHTIETLSKYAPETLGKYFSVGQVSGNNSGPPPSNGGGSSDFSPMVPPGYGAGGAPVPPGAQSQTVADPQKAALVDSYIRQGLSYGQALRQLKADAPGADLSGTTPGEWAKAVQWRKQHPNADVNQVLATKAVPLSDKGIIPGTSLFSPRDMNAAAQTGTGAFLGHFANLATGGLPGALAGDQGAYFDAVSRQQHPALSTVGDIGGGIAGALGAGKAVDAAAPFLGRFGPLATATPARTAMLGDLLYGGGTGAVQNPDHPLLGAAEGAAAMGAGNIAGRYTLGPALAAAGETKIGQTLADMVAKRSGGSFSPPPALGPGQSLVVNSGKKNLGDIMGRMQEASDLGVPYALADADPKLRVLAGSATRKSPDVRTLAETVLVPRQMGQGERAIQQINANLAPVGDVPAIKADALARAQAASQPLYTKAMRAPAPNDPALMEMLDTPAGGQAVRNAYAIALNKGEKPAELSFATGPNGEPIINQNPNWKTLQYTKMGLDKVIADTQNPITGKLDLSDPANKAMNDLRGRFVARLGELNPDYAAANQAYQNIVSQGTAAERGAAATGSRVTPEQTQIAVTNAGDNLPFFQRGYASDLADQIERQRMASNPFNLIFGSMGQRAKMDTVFPQGAQNFARANDLEGDMAKTAYETLGGSPTASRMEADKLFGNPMADAAIDLGTSAITGAPPIRAIGRVALKLSDLQNLGLRGAKAKADQLGPILLNPDPNVNMMTLADLIRMNAARQQYVGQARTLGGLLGAPVTLGLTTQGQ
jgi:hypothetical protein